MDSIKHIIDLMIEAFGPMGPVWVMGGFAALLMLSAAPIVFSRRSDPFARLQRDRDAMRLSGQAGARRRAEIERLRADDKPSRLSSLAPLFEPKDKKALSSAREQLIQAGYRSRAAVQTYFVARVLGAVLLALGALLYSLLRGSEAQMLAYTVVGGMAVGYFAPNYWVTRRRGARQQEIQDGFPDALDMMLVCVEAGQSLDQALMRVADEITHAHPSLAEEFQIVSVEMRAGKERATVLRDFANRSGVQDVGSFVTVLIQSSQFGTSIAEALRVYGAEMRDKRVMRAEEKANKLPTKLTLGTMFFTVPPLMLILIGPSLVDIMKVMAGGK
ncbi:MAG: type II secretion system F family protein [Pseudomonadota bacterium]|nr:type II secretion system F family protein [Pseudomonadota bacterium]MEE3100882.1 type II secretion system F family protein [Pseudomonadota bacterium]